ncbi:MAG: hypothetical protein VX460_09000, partial [Planctomycetota bacterium]|nr:hypothetical protein [Planctomycetota bacterium]
SVWPWRSRTDTDADVARRERISRTTRVLDEPFGTSGGRFEWIVTPEGLAGPTSDRASATAPVARAAGGDPARGPVGPVEGPGATAFEGVAPGASPLAKAAAEAPERSPAGALDQRSPDGGALIPPDRLGTMGFATEQANAAEARRARSEAPQVVPFDPAQWRGLRRAQLNGTGGVAAERGSGVEVRVLGGGRTKVFVSSGSPAPRWCFTPRADYLMQPGAVAVFEADGRLRMSFGTLEEHRPQPGRPTFDRLPPR